MNSDALVQPQKDKEREATPQAVEDTPPQKRASATAARAKRTADAAAQNNNKEGEATPQEVEDTPGQEPVPATAARPKRAAAAAAQRAIAATAVKRQRGRHMSGASLASVPGAQAMCILIICLSQGGTQGQISVLEQEDAPSATVLDRSCMMSRFSILRSILSGR